MRRRGSLDAGRPANRGANSPPACPPPPPPAHPLPPRPPPPRLRAEGVKAEALYAKDGTLPDPTSTDNPEFQIVLGLIRDCLPKDPQR